MRVYSASIRRSVSISSDTSSVAVNSANQVSPNDLAVLKQKFQFIRDDEVDAEQGETDWQVRMSVRYYQQLFREYALADLSRYKEGKIGLRWRTEMEVIAGKGQFSCGNKRCDKREELHSYELLFAYVEHGERKQCLVKVRACSECARMLFYKKMTEMKRKEEKKERKRQRLEKDDAKQKAKRRRQSTPHSDPDSSEVSERSSDGEDQDTNGDIHQLCAKINAEQQTAYPAGASRIQVSVKSDSGFDDLLP
ncbi:Protein FRA10AC1 [Phytophthora citrophthora]|uniref:Protein FRA10AC1 n=1 Tax=Phytophthora citrophthora TaxID=4793 RepID=A0AAD9LBV3_9STRA|nr:Protein FRA10AC1 [Phytophthora citrophthora]